MSAFASTSNYCDLAAESRNTGIVKSMDLLTISEDEPMRTLEHTFSSYSFNNSMSRSKSYKIDLSSLAASPDMSLSNCSQEPTDWSYTDQAAWGYFVDTVNRS
jgi:hypothetical protein